LTTEAAGPVVGRRRARPAIKLWHRWFGLLAGLWLSLLALTGCIITFYDELDTWLNPDLRTVAAAPVRVPVDLALAHAQAALPGFRPSQIDLPNAPGESIWMIGRAPGPDGGPGSVQVFVDPADGRVLGWRDSGRLSLDRRHLMDLIYGLHVDLLLGPWVTWAFGVVSLLWLFDHVFSLILAVPRMRRWREAFGVAGRQGSLRRLFDLHRAPGMWAFPITLVLAGTGVTLAWPDDSRGLVRTIAPVSERLHEAWPDAEPPAAPISMERAMVSVGPLETIDSLRPLAEHGVYAIRTFDRRDPDDQGRLWTYVLMIDGRIVAKRHDNGEGAGDAFFAWQYPLHSGQAFGIIGRIAVFLGGVATVWLSATGIVLWLRRISARSPR
jgi:uncharacterized iron-regulated membrane protein